MLSLSDQFTYLVGGGDSGPARAALRAADPLAAHAAAAPFRNWSRSPNCAARSSSGRSSRWPIAPGSWRSTPRAAAMRAAMSCCSGAWRPWAVPMRLARCRPRPRSRSVLLGLPLAFVLIAERGHGPRRDGDGARSRLLFVTLKLNEAQNVTFTRLVQFADRCRAREAARRIGRAQRADRALAGAQAGRYRRADRARQPARLARRNRDAGARRPRAVRGRAARPRRVQGDQRHLRPFDGRRIAGRGQPPVERPHRGCRASSRGSAGTSSPSCSAATASQSAGRLIAQAIARIAEPYTHHNRNLMVSACAGIAFRSASESDPTQTIRMADIALFSAKRKGRGTVETVFRCAGAGGQAACRDRDGVARARRRERDRAGLPADRRPRDRWQVCSFEALARWRHSELGWISPSEFIPITEQISVVERISEVLLRAGRGGSRALAVSRSACRST